MGKFRKVSDKWIYPSWNIHIDGPWSEDVRKYGAPLRAYIWTPWTFIIIALWPGHGSQIYDWKTKNWTDKWSWIAFDPRPDKEQNWKKKIIIRRLLRLLMMMFLSYLLYLILNRGKQLIHL